MRNRFFASVIISIFLTCGIAYAHVTVKPAQAGIATFQTFMVSVPVEKNVPTVGIRLVVPEGVTYVTPNAKTGWKVTTKKTGTGDSERVTEIFWTNGSIGAGLRDEFVFSAKTPSVPGTVVWKAYQTYQDGSVVAWDAAPVATHNDMDAEPTANPASVTKVVDDLTSGHGGMAMHDPTLYVSVLALVISLVSLTVVVKTRRKQA